MMLLPLILVVVVESVAARTFAFTSPNGAAQFELFKTTYSKQYASDEEEERRKSIFQASLNRIALKQVSCSSPKDGARCCSGRGGSVLC